MPCGARAKKPKRYLPCRLQKYPSIFRDFWTVRRNNGKNIPRRHGASDRTDAPCRPAGQENTHDFTGKPAVVRTHGGTAGHAAGTGLCPYRQNIAAQRPPPGAGRSLWCGPGHKRTYHGHHARHFRHYRAVRVVVQHPEIRGRGLPYLARHPGIASWAPGQRGGGEGCSAG